MPAKKRVSRRSLGSDLKRVDAHKIKPHEYVEAPRLSDEMLSRMVLKKRGRPITGNARRLLTLRLPVEVIERCSGHNGTYAVKKEYRAASVKIGRPVMSKVQAAQPEHYSSDCPMAGHQIQSGLTPREGEAAPRAPEHPLSLIRKAYGL